MRRGGRNFKALAWVFETIAHSTVLRLRLTRRQSPRSSSRHSFLSCRITAKHSLKEGVNPQVHGRYSVYLEKRPEERVEDALQSEEHTFHSI